MAKLQLATAKFLAARFVAPTVQSELAVTLPDTESAAKLNLICRCAHQQQNPANSHLLSRSVNSSLHHVYYGPFYTTEDKQAAPSTTSDHRTTAPRAQTARRLATVQCPTPPPSRQCMSVRPSARHTRKRRTAIRRGQHCDVTRLCSA